MTDQHRAQGKPVANSEFAQFFAGQADRLTLASRSRNHPAERSPTDASVVAFCQDDYSAQIFDRQIHTDYRIEAAFQAGADVFYRSVEAVAVGDG